MWSSLLQQVKNDLGEFTAVISSDVSSLTSGMQASYGSSVVTSSSDGPSTGRVASPGAAAQTTLRHSAELLPCGDGDHSTQLAVLQESRSTYTSPIPDDESSAFAAWKDAHPFPSLSATIEGHTTEKDGIVALRFAELVPLQVTAAEFWSRYLYREDRLFKEIERRRLLRSVTAQLSSAADADELSWDEPHAPPTKADTTALAAQVAASADLLSAVSRSEEEATTLRSEKQRLEQALAELNVNSAQMAHNSLVLCVEYQEGAARSVLEIAAMQGFLEISLQSAAVLVKEALRCRSRESPASASSFENLGAPPATTHPSSAPSTLLSASARIVSAAEQLAKSDGDEDWGTWS